MVPCVHGDWINPIMVRRRKRKTFLLYQVRQQSATEVKNEDKEFQAVHGRNFTKWTKKGEEMQRETDGYLLKGKENHFIYPHWVTEAQFKERVHIAGLHLDEKAE